jgi:hypothetical protein
MSRARRKARTQHFHVGDRVYIPQLKTQGRITEVINAGDDEDIKQQGYRYEVATDFRKDLWSLLQASLRHH